MQILVKTLSGKTLTFDVQPSDTVLKLKAMVQDKLGRPPHQELRLECHGKDMPDGETMAHFNMDQLSVIHVLPDSGR